MIDGMSEICIDCVHQEVCRYECHRPSEHCNDRAVADDFIPKGEWEFDREHTEFGNPYGTYKCSCCGGHSFDKYPYCFWCGAEMRKGDES